ncbi:MAG: SGNH/GDSL hydrolase family protein [Lachnospiraceae bacterium]|nr:SGNH/GDSL hydrolase family protein [Lachnospiraceae bacterium]
MSEQVPGPKAPKDPTAKRPYFYVMHNKQIFASPQEDGRGIQFIYENDGRFADSARLVGNVTDKEILELMPKTAGFRKLVHSIGVSVSEKDNADVTFVLQMYPEDPADPATNLIRTFKADGNEQLIVLEDEKWEAADDIVGQIRFEFDTPEKLATVDVRLYLNDGFEAPEQIAENDVPFESDKYKEMISRSLVSTGDESGIRALIKKAEAGEKITLAFIGGSITQGAGAIPIHEKSYARVFADDFADKYSSYDKTELIKAGVGGTPSELGMIRFTRDVLRDGAKKPDLIVIEFAVNDAGDETNGECYESLVRKALSLPWHPAVVLIFAVFSDDYNLQERMIPIGEHYRVPMVSVKNAVSPQFNLTPDEGRVISKNQYFYDQFHPSNNGHIVMSDCIMNLIDQVKKNMERAGVSDLKYPDHMSAYEKTIKEVLKLKPVLGDRFENVELLDKKDDPLKVKTIIDAGDFGGTDDDIQRVEMDSEVKAVPEFPNNWHYAGQSKEPKPFVMKCVCKRILAVMKDSGLAQFGKAVVTVDGKKVMEYNPLDIGWTHCNPVIIYSGDETAEHEVVISMAPGDEGKKFTILGFGVVE